MGETISTSRSTNKGGQVIDGFVKASLGKKGLVSSAHKLHRGTERAQTLMRGALKKPTNATPRVQKPTSIDYHREFRAKKITKDERVNRFGHPVATSQPQVPIQSSRKNTHTPKSAHTTNKSIINKNVVVPSLVASASHQKLERMLDAALTQADAHKKALKYEAARHFWQKPGFLGRRRGMKISLFLLFIFTGVLFAAWQKMPALSVKLAGAKAHIGASVPTYKPEGYSLAAPATVQNGSVVLKYKGSNNSDSFELAQTESHMTSSNLPQMVIPKGTQVQTSQVQGNTVYIYGPSNDAAWVNNGMLYTLKDKSKLSSDEIIKIVQGMNE
jgi:hypothetical protein